jgi:hypothetical protein
MLRRMESPTWIEGLKDSIRGSVNKGDLYRHLGAAKESLKSWEKQAIYELQSELLETIGTDAVTVDDLKSIHDEFEGYRQELRAAEVETKKRLNVPCETLDI